MLKAADKSVSITVLDEGNEVNTVTEEVFAVKMLVPEESPTPPKDHPMVVVVPVLLNQLSLKATEDPSQLKGILKLVMANDGVEFGAKNCRYVIPKTL